MKILHITPAYYPATYWGGPIFTVWHLNNALASLPDVELKVLTTDSAGPRILDRLDVSELDRQWYPNQEVIFSRRIAAACVSPGLLKRLTMLIRWSDVVHLTATYSFPTIPTLIACRWFDKPLVWSLRGAILDDDAWMCLKKKRLKWLWLKVCKTLIRSGRVCLHVTSEQEKMISMARIPHANTVVVKNGVKLPSSVPKREWQPGGRLRLLFMGRLAPKKGVENLLDAMKMLEDDSRIALNLCGSGDKAYSSKLNAHAKKLDLPESRVCFLGHVDGQDKTSAFLNADVCVVPSFSENFCIVVAEALASGLPVIVSSRLPQWQDVESRGCGLWMENDPATLAQAIRKMRDMDLSAMGQKGWRWMKEEFEWATIGKKMLNEYRRIIEGQSHAS